MMSFVAASGFLSMINFSGIEVKILPQGDAFALTPATLKFSLINGKAVIPSYSLNLEIDEKTAFIPYLPPKVDTGASLKHVFRERGWNKIPEARLSTRFPFGFFRKWIKIDLQTEVLVFPK
jgi:uncharacterized protein (DUF58 family)